MADSDGIVSAGKGNIEAQSAFASTLVADVEKAPLPKHSSTDTVYRNLYGSAIETPETHAGADVVFAAKAQLLNKALLDLGMGRYQWFLWLITSTGWFLDSFWIMSFLIIDPSASNEALFFYSSNGDRAAYLFVSLFVGLTVGATAWPFMADTLGRKWIFTSTLVLMGMGGLVGAGMPAFTGLCIVGFVVGFAVAGNQAVDGMVLLETIPASHQFLVAMQGVFWGLGQLVASAVGWAFISQWTCGTGPDEVSTADAIGNKAQATGGGGSNSSSGSSNSCHYVTNKGWRYVWWTFGCITLFLYLCRFAFPLRETPKFLLARRRDAEATQLVNDIALYDKRKTWLTESSFARIDSTVDAETVESQRKSRIGTIVASLKLQGLLLLLLLWTVTGLTFPLHKTYISNYLAIHGVSAVNATTVTTPYLYSRYLYVALCAIPGPLAAMLLIEAKGLGRKRSGAIVAVLTGLFMLLSTTARTRDAALAFECILSFLQYAGLAILTTYTLEVFPTPVRGFSVGLMGFSWRVFGLIAAIITTFDSTAIAGGAPVWFSGAIWIVIAGAWLGLPVETKTIAAA